MLRDVARFDAGGARLRELTRVSDYVTGTDMSVLNRRTYLRADQRKEQILDIAKDVFARVGVRDANVADICEAAKIGRGTLYQYFENKNDVLRAVMNRIGDRIVDAVAKRPTVASIPGVAGAPLEMVIAFCTRRVRQILDVDEAIARIDATMLGAIEADIRAAQVAGVLRADLDARLAALYVLGGIEKVVLAALAGDAAVDLDALVKATVEIQMFGMLKKAEAGR
jgi:AcrR family transcriptional regulator